jgi:hypothetical protein
MQQLTARAAAPASRLRRGAPAARAQLARQQHATAHATAFMTGVKIGSSARAPLRAVAGRRPQRGAACSAARPQATPADASGMTVLVAEKLGAAGIDMLKAYGTVVEAFDMSQADLCAKVSLCDALIVRSATKARTPSRLTQGCAPRGSRATRAAAPGGTWRLSAPRAEQNHNCRLTMRSPSLLDDPRSLARCCRLARAASRWSVAPAWASTTWTWRPPRRRACSS